jgi:hypothetical protein
VFASVDRGDHGDSHHRQSRRDADESIDRPPPASRTRQADVFRSWSPAPHGG